MTYPTEFVKTSMQLSKAPLTVGQVVKSTLRGPGFMGLYRGLPSMVYFAAPKASIRFGAFEAVNGLLSTESGGDKYKLGGAKGFVAGLAAGTLEAVFVTTPQVMKWAPGLCGYFAPHPPNTVAALMPVVRRNHPFPSVQPF